MRLTRRHHRPILALVKSMRKAKSTISGIGAVAALIGVVIVVVVVLVIVDVARTPPPPAAPQETCTLVRHIVLPDACVCSVAGKSCHPTKTSPYLIFFQQPPEYPTLRLVARVDNR